MFKTISKTKYIAITVLVSLVFSFVPLVTYAASSISLLDNRVEEINGKTVKIIWQTDSATKGKIIFGETAQTMSYYIVDGDSYRKYHEVELSNLKPETTYYYQVVMFNASEQATSYVRSFTTDEYNDCLPPQLTNVSVPYISGTIAFVSWKSHEDGTSVVQYSEDESYGLVAYSKSRVQDHEIILKNLKVNTDYYLRVYSVDKDGNQSSYHYRKIRTSISNNVDTQTFKVENFRPATVSDVLVGTNQITVNFKTNHYARGYISVSRPGFRTQTQEVGYSVNHTATFAGLSADMEYTIGYNMVSIYNRTITGTYTAYTKKVSTSSNNNSTTTTTTTTTTSSNGVVVAGISYDPYKNGSGLTDSFCSNEVVNTVGYYGRYNNLPNDMPGLADTSNTAAGYATGWYAENYLTFAQIDKDLKFPGSMFLPMREKIYGMDPFYFSVNWRAILEVPRDMNYQYQIGVDNSGWVYIDGQLVTDLGGLEPHQSDSNSISLSAGYHYLEIFYAERGPGQAKFSYTATPGVIPHPWPSNCNLLPGGNIIDTKDYSNQEYGGSVNNNNNNNDNNIVVAGAEFSLYTKASALLKTYESPDVYAIMNGQRHYISSPASFSEYGFSWYNVKTVTRGELEKYPRARLIKSGEGDTINYLYQRPEGQWLKIDINSPTVFISYPGNFWGNVINVTQLDVDSYPDVKLIKTKDNSDIYYVHNNERHLVSGEVFVKKGYNKYEVSEVNKTHMESYKIATPWY